MGRATIGAVPYTLAHAAAVVPLWRLRRDRLSLSALVAGSFAPDILYYRGDYVGALDAHGARGLVVWAVPLGLGLLFVFHALLKRPALWLLPEDHRRVLSPHAGPYRIGGARKLLFIVLAVLIGAFTHVLWDAFTHDDMAVGPLAWLRLPIVWVGPASFSIARVLQLVCSVVGLGLLARWYLAWWRQERATAAAPVSVGDPSAELTEADEAADGIEAADAGLVTATANPFVTTATRSVFLGLLFLGSPLLGRLWLGPWTRPASYRVVIWMVGTTNAAFLVLCGWSLLFGAGALLGNVRARRAATTAQPQPSSTSPAP